MLLCCSCCQKGSLFFSFRVRRVFHLYNYIMRAQHLEGKISLFFKRNDEGWWRLHIFVQLSRLGSERRKADNWYCFWIISSKIQFQDVVGQRTSFYFLTRFKKSLRALYVKANQVHAGSLNLVIETTHVFSDIPHSSYKAIVFFITKGKQRCLSVWKINPFLLLSVSFF